MRTSWSRTIGLGLGMVLLALLSTDCFRPASDGPLFLETSAVLPPPDPNETVLAYYNSSDKRARITVIPGTVIPSAGLTVESIDPNQVAGPLRSNANHFALRLGPDGTQFNMPVRLSFLVGEGAQNSDGSYVVPTVEVVTEDAAKVETLTPPLMQVTEDGLLIAHVAVNHFSDVVYRLKVGLDVRIDTPADDAVFLLGEFVDTGMIVKNRTEDFMRVQAFEATKPVLGNVLYNNSMVELPSLVTKPVGIGNCLCSKVGDGVVEFELKGDYDVMGDIDPSWVHFKKFRDINCSDLETQIVVTFDPETHTTKYDVSVFHTTKSTSYMRVDISNNVRVKYRWTTISTCGTFGNPGDNPVNTYEHEGCTATQEAAARVAVEVTYTADDGRQIKRQYDMPARANEGKGPIAF